MKPSFEDVVKDYIRLVYFFAKRWIVRHQEVDDVVQDTFLRALNAYDSFIYKTRGELKSWLLTICRNIIIDNARSYKMQKKDISIDKNDIELSDDHDIEQWLETQIKNQDIKSIQHELNRMKLEDQEIIKLRIFDELEFKHIGTILGISEPSTKMRFYRAIERLKENVLCNTKTL